MNERERRLEARRKAFLDKKNGNANSDIQDDANRPLKAMELQLPNKPVENNINEDANYGKRNVFAPDPAPSRPIMDKVVLPRPEIRSVTKPPKNYADAFDNGQLEIRQPRIEPVLQMQMPIDSFHPVQQFPIGNRYEEEGPTATTTVQQPPVRHGNNPIEGMGSTLELKEVKRSKQQEYAQALAADQSAARQAASGQKVYVPQIPISGIQPSYDNPMIGTGGMESGRQTNNNGGYIGGSTVLNLGNVSKDVKKQRQQEYARQLQMDNEVNRQTAQIQQVEPNTYQHQTQQQQYQQQPQQPMYQNQPPQQPPPVYQNQFQPPKQGYQQQQQMYPQQPQQQQQPVYQQQQPPRQQDMYQQPLPNQHQYPVPYAQPSQAAPRNDRQSNKQLVLGSNINFNYDVPAVAQNTGNSRNAYMDSEKAAKMEKQRAYAEALKQQMQVPGMGSVAPQAAARSNPVISTPGLYPDGSLQPGWVVGPLGVPVRETINVGSRKLAAAHNQQYSPTKQRSPGKYPPADYNVPVQYNPGNYGGYTDPVGAQYPMMDPQQQAAGIGQVLPQYELAMKAEEEARKVLVCVCNSKLYI